MSQNTQIAIFKGRGIRRTLHNNEWWFSVVDVVEFLLKVRIRVIIGTK